MPLILATTAVPGDSYWITLPAGGLVGWSEDGDENLYPNTNGLQDLGLPTKRVGAFYGNTVIAQSSLFDPTPPADLYFSVTNGSVLASDQKGGYNAATFILNGSIAAVRTLDYQGYRVVRAQDGAMLSFYSYGSYYPSYDSNILAEKGSNTVVAIDPSAYGNCKATALMGSSVSAFCKANGYAVAEVGSSIHVYADVNGKSYAYIGSHVMGLSEGFGKLQASNGSIVLGSSRDYGEIVSNTYSIAIGQTQGNNSVITADQGGVAIGSAGGGGQLIAGIFSTALGAARGGNVQANLGGFTLGFSSSSYTGDVIANNAGAVAMGHAGAYNILSSAYGSFASGYSTGGNITASAPGTMALGYAFNYAITASVGGAIALGYADTAAILANAVGALQFNSGTNSVENSIKVGADTTGMRLIGSGATTTRNGDMWCDGTDVFVRTGGVTKNMTSI